MPGHYLRHPASLDHDTGGHPENAGRIRAIESALEQRDWLGLEVRESPAASTEQLLRVHPQAHIDAIRELAESGGGMIDMDTIASAGSWDAALRSAGGAVAAVDAVMSGEAPFAFSATRPPGHHAEHARAMGFCLFNNVAVAAEHALAEHDAGRVAVVDWDVHHGNGTEAIFYASDRVLYASVHQAPLYPGTGAAADTGTGEGEGWTVNCPVRAGSGRQEFLAALEGEILPALRRAEPGLIAISAGYDAHAADPLANCRLGERDFAEMATLIAASAADLGAGLIVCLEGGYDLGALAASAVATLEALRDG
jgi:acetoin utilization deacetylase AcuC-like enzyme